MHPQRVLRAGLPLEVAVLALMSSIRGAGCLLAAAAPLSEETPRQLMVGLGATSAAIAVGLVLLGANVRATRLHAVVVAQIAIVTVLTAISATERGMMIAAMGFLWMAIYVAIFFSPAKARLYATLLTAGVAIGLLTARTPADLTIGVMLSAMVWGSVAILGSLSAQLRAQAHTDGLTGLLNRTGFALAAARQRALAQRNGIPVSLAVIDLDDFKLVNDQGGHAAGDRLLAELASAWTASLRPADVLARYGGDEFVVLLPGATAEQAERLLTRLAGVHPGAWTAGVVPCSNDQSLDQVIAHADVRLYEAKASRRRAIAAQSAESWPALGLSA